MNEKSLPSVTVSDVINDLLEREEKGVEKYGCTVDRKDYTKREWLQNAYEEALDFVVYMRRLLIKIDAFNARYPKRQNYTFPDVFPDWDDEGFEGYHWRAFDANGELTYFKHEPKINELDQTFVPGHEYPGKETGFRYAGQAGAVWAEENWKKSLERRP